MKYLPGRKWQTKVHGPVCGSGDAVDAIDTMANTMKDPPTGESYRQIHNPYYSLSRD